MRDAILLVVAMVAFVSTVFVPSGPDGGDGTFGRESAEQRRSQQRERDAYASWSAGETILERSGDGHFYADVTINGSTVRTLVDTGASVVSLTADDAQALGLSWDEAEVTVIGSGASGPVMGVQITLDTVELGSHQASQVDAVIVTEGLGITLLGQSFLQTINPVRIEGERMVLGG